MLDRLGTNPTQFVGTLAFGGAAVACLIAAGRPRFGDKRAWKILALIYCLLTIEVLVGFRHSLHDLCAHIFEIEQGYSSRGPVQELLTLFLAVVAIILTGFVLFLFRFDASGARIATMVALAVLALFAIETISLHPIDAILYRSTASVMTVGWIWAGAGAITMMTSLPLPRSM
jgi:hypothetical protein